MMYGNSGSIGSGSESVYSAWKTEAERLATLKTEYEAYLRNPDFSNGNYRANIINLGRILINEVSDIIGEDYDQLDKILRDLSQIDQQILVFSTSSSGMSGLNMVLVGKNNSDAFQVKAHYFMRQLNTIFQKHKLGMKTKKAENEIKRMFKIFNVEDKFKNAHGAWISSEIETLARICACRVNGEWDNFLGIEGETGMGKSMLAYGLGSTIAEKVGIPFDVEHNILFNESKEYVTKRIKMAEQGDVIILDEAGNQANTKTWWEKDQVAFMNLLNLVRFHNLTLIIVWTDFKNLDKTLRERIHGIISIKQRGQALLRTFNKNPYSNERINTPINAKKLVVQSGEQAENIMQVYDQTILATIPYYKIPDSLWEKYKIRKEKAMSMASLSKRIGGASKLLAEDYYSIFLLEYPVDKFQITSNELERFAKKNNFALSMKKLALGLAKATGQKIEDIFTNTNPAESYEGYITKNSYIDGYIARLREQKIGSQNAKEEQGETL